MIFYGITEKGPSISIGIKPILKIHGFQQIVKKLKSDFDAHHCCYAMVQHVNRKCVFNNEIIKICIVK